MTFSFTAAVKQLKRKKKQLLRKCALELCNCRGWRKRQLRELGPFRDWKKGQ